MSEPLIVESGLEYMVPIHYLIKLRLASWTEATQQMNVMEVEHMLHLNRAMNAQRERARARRSHLDEHR